MNASTETTDAISGGPHRLSWIRKKQAELFEDGRAAKYFAVRSNPWDWKPKRLLEWHREKAGSIEAAHAVIKNELVGGVLPCGRFSANAAWLRFAVLT